MPTPARRTSQASTANLPTPARRTSQASTANLPTPARRTSQGKHSKSDQSGTSHQLGKHGKPANSGKSPKSGKHNESDQSGKSPKSGKPNESDQSGKSPKSGKRNESDQSGKSPKSGKRNKSDQSGKSPKSGKHNESDQSGKSPKSGKRNESANSGKSPKSGKRNESAQSGKSPKSGKRNESDQPGKSPKFGNHSKSARSGQVRKRGKRSKYDGQEANNPVPGRQRILAQLEALGRPVSYAELCEHLHINPGGSGKAATVAEVAEVAEGLRRRLIAMCRDGQLISNRRGVYCLAAHIDVLKGRVQGNRDGGGFFIPEDGSDDLHLPPRQMARLFDGDRVLARASGIGYRGRQEAEVVEILDRRYQEIVGRYYADSGFGLVVPDNKRINHEIVIPAGATGGMKAPTRRTAADPMAAAESAGAGPTPDATRAAADSLG